MRIGMGQWHGPANQDTNLRSTHEPSKRFANPAESKETKTGKQAFERETFCASSTFLIFIDKTVWPVVKRGLLCGDGVPQTQDVRNSSMRMSGLGFQDG